MLYKFSWPKQDAWTVVIFVHFFLLILLLLGALAYLNPTLYLSYLPTDTMVLVMAVFLLIVSVWCLWSWQAATGSLFDLYSVCLIAAALFNGGQAFLEIFHLNEYGILDGKFSPQIILETLFLVTLGLTAFHAGALLGLPAAYRRNPLREEEENTVPTEQALRLVGWGLLAVSFIPALLHVRDSLSLVWSSGYGGFLGNTWVEGFSLAALPRVIALHFFIPGCLFLLAGSKNVRFGTVVSGFIIVAYALTLFYVGDRHSSTLALISFAWIYHRAIRPLPKGLLLGIGSLLVFVVFPVLASIRGVRGEARSSPDALVTAFFSIENPIVASISEMGNSMMTVAYTISLVPSYRNFGMGASYLYSFFPVIPNLGWQAPSGLASYAALDDWLIQTVSPLTANRGQYSWAYSFIAEAYFNFGWVGAPLALGIMGFFLCKLVLWAYKSVDPARIALVGVIMSVLPIYARGEFLEIVRPVVWGALIPYLGVCVLRPLMRSQYSKKGAYFEH